MDVYVAEVQDVTGWSVLAVTTTYISARHVIQIHAGELIDLNEFSQWQGVTTRAGHSKRSGAAYRILEMALIAPFTPPQGGSDAR